MSENTSNENSTTETPAETETAPVVSDLSLLGDDARMAHNFMSKAVREAEAALAGSESEADTLFRVFSDADEKAKKSEILALVTKARENVPSEEEAAEIVKRAQKRYNAGLLAWEDEETPDNFFVPSFPNVKGKSGSGTGRGAGVPRPRGLRAETAEHKGTEDKPLTCSTLAQKIGDGITTASLLDAWKSVAGADSEAWSEGQTATVTVKGKSGTEHAVKFTYKKG